MASKNELLKRAKKVKAKIDRGNLKGTALKKARGQYYNLNYRASKANMTEVHARRKPRISKRGRKHEFVPEQGFLPSFLSQQSLVRIEEMVANRIFESLNKTSPVEITFASDRKAKRKGS